MFFHMSLDFKFIINTLLRWFLWSGLRSRKYQSRSYRSCKCFIPYTWIKSTLERAEKQFDKLYYLDTYHKISYYSNIKQMHCDNPILIITGTLFIYLFIYLHFIYRLQYIKTHDLKVQLNFIAVQLIRQVWLINVK